MKRIFYTAILFLALTTISAAQNVTTINVIGQPTQNIMHTLGEKPFFSKTLPEMTDGSIKANLRSYQQIGLGGADVLNLISNGSIQFGSAGLGQSAGESAVLEGCDLPGVTQSLEQARKICEAYRPVLEDELENKFGVKLLALGYNPPQALWCVSPINDLSDLKGKKVRIFSAALANFVSGAGGIPVDIPHADVVPSLKTGIIDCAITGTLTGNTANWYEVSSYLYPMSLGWGVQYWAVNIDDWNKFDRNVQHELTDAFNKLEDRMWTLAKRAVAQGRACNTGKPSCEIGVKASMKIVDVSEEAHEQRKEILEDKVLPGWIDRCEDGQNCKKQWNRLIGSKVGLHASGDK